MSHEDAHGRDDHHDVRVNNGNGDRVDTHIDAAIWALDNVELTTVGVDIGSATSHLMFSRVHLQRSGERLSSRFLVVNRTALHRSPILLTPYRDDGLIDADELQAFIADAYRAAGMARDEIDAGAVILTGVALERANARAIAELFAAEGGRFVCASAGHNLEALLAANGSGAARRSATDGPILNVDIGGGTTKLALCVDGRVVATTAVSAGARLITFDDRGRTTRIERTAFEIAGALGIDLSVGSELGVAERTAMAEALADRIVGAIQRDENVPRLAGELLPEPAPVAFVLSGGVAELMHAGVDSSFGDLGIELAAVLVTRLAALEIPVIASVERIRATVIGASQFSTQLSGNTVHMSGPIRPPLHNIPVAGADLGSGATDPAMTRVEIERTVERLDLADREEAIAVAVRMGGEMSFERLRSLASALVGAHLAAPRRDSPLVVVMYDDYGASLGNLITEEATVAGGIAVIDGLELADLDFIDIGERIQPANVVPVVVKSLIFP